MGWRATGFVEPGRPTAESPPPENTQPQPNATHRPIVSAPTLQRPLAIAALQACCLASLSATGLQAMAQQARDGAALPVAQTAADNNATESTLPGTTVSAPANRQARAGISGLGDTPGWQAPVQAQTFGQTVLRDAGITRLADLDDQVEACRTRGHRIRIKVAQGFVERVDGSLAYSPL